MTQRHYHTMPLGDLIIAAFEKASLLSLDPKETCFAGPSKES